MPDGLPQPSGVRGRPGKDRTAAPYRCPRGPVSGAGAHPAPGLPGQIPGPAVHAGQGLRLPHAGQPVRHQGAPALHFPRQPRRGGSRAGRQGRSGRGPETSPAQPAGPARPAAHAAPPHLQGARAGEPLRPVGPAPSGGLAPGRRALHHPAAGLQRGSRASRPGCLQPGHVPRAAGGQRLRRRRGGSALPDPPRHRRAPCRGPRTGPEPAGEHLRGRPAGLHRGGGHAPARRPVGTALRGPAGGAARGHALQPPPAAAGAGRGGFLHQRPHPAASQARRPLRGPCGLLQPAA